MSDFVVLRAESAHISAVTELALQLWEGHTAEELAPEFTKLIREADCAVFLAEQAGKYVGFAQCQLRRDYVEGTSTSPVGYLEGIYVCPEHRGIGLAKALLSRCERWAKEQGCTEFASDCELTNTASLAFHQALGFTEANRIICFTKPL